MIIATVAMSDAPTIAAEQDPEAALLRAWRDRRDRAALDELAVRLLPAGWRAARAFARGHAEDVLQDAFVILTTGAAGWRGGAVRSWFVGIIANTARDHQRRQRRRPAPLPPELPAPPEPSEPELAERVMAALQHLPEHERVPLWLNVVEGQECQDIAIQLGRPAGTVRAQVARAFERLRGLLGGAVAVVAISTALHQQAWAEQPPAGLATRLSEHAAVAKPTGVLPGATLAIAAAVALIAIAVLAWPLPPRPPSGTAAAVVQAAPQPAPAPAAAVRVLGAGPFQHDDDVQSIAVSPDGTRIAVGTPSGIHLWDLAGTKRLLTIDTSSEDPRKVLVATEQGLVERSGRREPGTPIHLIWLPGDRLLALVMCGSEFHYAGLWETGTGRPIRRLPLAALYYCRPALIGDDILLVPGRRPDSMDPSDRSAVLALRLDDGSELPPILGAAPLEAKRSWAVAAVAVDATGTRVACLATNAGASDGADLTDEGVVSVWSWPERAKLAERRLPRLKGGLPQLTWLADGRLQFTGGVDRGNRPITARLPADLAGEPAGEPGVLYHAADGSRLRLETGRAALLGSDGGERVLRGWTPGRSWRGQVEWLPGRLLAMAGPGRTPWLYDLAADRLLAPAPATLSRSANSLLWLPDGTLLAADHERTLRFAGGTGQADILPSAILRNGSGDERGGRAWGWLDGRPRVLARRSASDGGFVLIDPSGRSAVRELDLPAGYADLAAVSPDLHWAFVASQYGGTCSLLDLVDGTLAQWRHPNQDGRHNPSQGNPMAVRWVGGHVLIADYGSTGLKAGNDQSMTGVWSPRPFQRLHRFRRTDGSEILTAVDVVPHPDGERALVVPNDNAKQRAWVCRIADGACLDEIASPGGGAVWTADGAVITGRKAAVLLATRQPSVVFADLHPPLAQAGYQAFMGNAGAFGVAIGRVQPSPSGTQAAVAAGDRLLVVDARSGAIAAAVALGRDLVPALAAWSPGEAEVALADANGATVLVATVAEPSADPAADRALLADAARPAGERRAALARLEAADRAGSKPVLPAAGQDALLAAWLADAARRAEAEVPPPALPAPASKPSDF